MDAAANRGPTMHVEDAPARVDSNPRVQLTLLQGLRMWPKITLYCLSLTTAILLWGYDMAMVGNLAGLDQFQ